MALQHASTRSSARVLSLPRHAVACSNRHSPLSPPPRMCVVRRQFVSPGGAFCGTLWASRSRLADLSHRPLSKHVHVHTHFGHAPLMQRSLETSPRQFARPSAAATALHVRKLRVQFGNEAPLIEDLSFDLQVGEVLFVRGPSGIGKSRMLRALAGLDNCDVRPHSLSNMCPIFKVSHLWMQFLACTECPHSVGGTSEWSMRASSSSSLITLCSSCL